VSGIVVTLILAAFGGLVGLAGGPIGSLLGGAGVLVAGLFLTLLFAIDSALAGAIGARTRRLSRFLRDHSGRRSR